MAKIEVTLLDFSSGDTEVTIGDKEQLLSTPETEALVLSYSDETPVVLRRSYAKGKRETTVGELRSEVEFGWWGWPAG